LQDYGKALQKDKVIVDQQCRPGSMEERHRVL